ncbi:MAG: hypothetical protein HRU15_02180 [Planctomycetes bacterium]|nr:hypothetical protein [Planctomycetota bacterium]
MKKRYQVLVGLHESRVVDARRCIGLLEQQYQVQDDAIMHIRHEQQQAAIHVTHLLHEQYLHYCLHLQQKITQYEQIKLQIATRIEGAWEGMREAKRELDIFLSLQQRHEEKEQIKEKRREQRRYQDYALMKCMETH